MIRKLNSVMHGDFVHDSAHSKHLLIYLACSDKVSKH